MTYFFTITNKTFFSILRLSYNGVLKRSTWVPKPQQLWKRVDRILPHDACGLYNKCVDLMVYVIQADHESVVAFMDLSRETKKHGVFKTGQVGV